MISKHDYNSKNDVFRFDYVRCRFCKEIIHINDSRCRWCGSRKKIRYKGIKLGKSVILLLLFVFFFSAGAMGLKAVLIIPFAILTSLVLNIERNLSWFRRKPF